MSKDQQYHLENMRRRYERRLQVLEEKAATLGISTPPEIITEIEDIRAELNKLKGSRTMNQSKSGWRAWGDHPIIIGILVITAIIGAGMAVLPFFKPSTPTEYVGRILDSRSQTAIHSAKISLDLQGAPPIIYSDSEGIYRFLLSLSTERIAGKIRVEAERYEPYERNITLDTEIPKIEDIRLIAVNKPPIGLVATPTGIAEPTLTSQSLSTTALPLSTTMLPLQTTVSPPSTVTIAATVTADSLPLSRSPMPTNNNYALSGTIAETGSASGSNFRKGMIITVHNEYIYVIDNEDNMPPRIMKLSISGELKDEFVATLGTDEGQFGFIQGIAFDSSGNIYVTDGSTGRMRIQKFDNALQSASMWAKGEHNFGDPRGIAIDSTGNVYVADAVNNCIVKFSNDGKLLDVWGDVGDSISLNLPWDVAFDPSGYIYIADRGNNRILKVEAINGNLITVWDSKEVKGGFSEPQGVTVDSQGSIYVADSTNHRIVKQSSEDGQWRVIWGTGGAGSQPNQLSAPSSVGIDSHGSIYIADSMNNRIQVLMSR